MQNRAEVVDQNFVRRVSSGDLPQSDTRLGLQDAGLGEALLLQLFESQVLSRQLDLCARRLQVRGEAFYTIGSAGHEGNAAIAAAFRQDDIAFLHYRDAAFFVQRARQAAAVNPLWDMLLSFTASSEDPISGGRHKVLGSKALFVPPQTSTIASHLPKALGAAVGIALARRLKHPGILPADGAVLCAFGDASANHSTALGAINSACWMGYQKHPLPLVFICEDNGIGISTPTPDGWIAASFSQRPGLHYLSCNGLDLLDTYRCARQAEQLARRHHQPVFLHMHCVRLLGHAGSDAQSAYLSAAQIEHAEARDPLLHSARLLIELGIRRPDQVVALYQGMAAQVNEAAERAIRRPRLNSAAAVMASIIPSPRPVATMKPAPSPVLDALFARDRTLLAQPQPMARLLNWALAELMATYPEILLMGEDIGPKGGVYNVTGKLCETFGKHRVINTLLDEQSILGLAIGVAHNGFIPIPEIQFLAYVHNAEDQLRGEAASLSFFSNGQYSNPMVIRIAGLGYQKGFGGHFHNDNSLAVFRDIPGVILACPSNGRDAAPMLRECVRLAREDQRVVVFIEPIALYTARDLLEPGDGRWSFEYVPAARCTPIPLGHVGQEGEGRELAIISYGNGYYLSRQAGHDLATAQGIALRLIDLRWLQPLPADAIVAAVRDCEAVLIVDECRRSGSLSEALMTLLIERLDTPPRLKRLCAEDSFIALGPAATVTLPSRASIREAALALLGRSSLE